MLPPNNTSRNIRRFTSVPRPPPPQPTSHTTVSVSSSNTPPSPLLRLLFSPMLQHNSLPRLPRVRHPYIAPAPNAPLTYEQDPAAFPSSRKSSPYVQHSSSVHSSSSSRTSYLRPFSVHSSSQTSSSKLISSPLADTPWDSMSDPLTQKFQLSRPPPSPPSQPKWWKARRVKSVVTRAISVGGATEELLKLTKEGGGALGTALWIVRDKIEKGYAISGMIVLHEMMRVQGSEWARWVSRMAMNWGGIGGWGRVYATWLESWLVMRSGRGGVSGMVDVLERGARLLEIHGGVERARILVRRDITMVKTKLKDEMRNLVRAFGGMGSKEAVMAMRLYARWVRVAGVEKGEIKTDGLIKVKKAGRNLSLLSYRAMNGNAEEEEEEETDVEDVSSVTLVKTPFIGSTVAKLSIGGRKISEGSTVESL